MTTTLKKQIKIIIYYKGKFSLLISVNFVGNQVVFMIWKS